ncbi:peptidylprolyl isomerase [Conchiformibius steedae]|uniref:Peptidylprolyl isomerase n=1 Tax=Conchiformibius steedae TaxID=153493 RepID=A0A3P2A135_9NEIS|nr:peptidylprolyl isomerase [Conchiformibius steedae]RRD89117.1 peptidylprolyl isomerase [Conchiformibius steedae]
MKTSRIKPLFYALLIAAAGNSAAAEIRTLNSIAAEINGNIITYGDIARTATVMHENAGRADIPREQVLQAARQSLMERALMVDEARNKQLKTTPAEIDNEITRRANQAGVNTDKIYADAARLGWNREQYRLEVAKDLLIEKVMADLTEGINITPHQIDQYIESAAKENRTLPAGEPYTVYQVRRILIKISKNNTASSVGKRMDLIANAVVQGNDFGALAKRYSQEPAAAQGGLQDLTDHSEAPKVEALLQKLSVGQTAAPVQTAHNWQMLQLVGKRTETDPEKIRREAVRRLLRTQELEKAHQQFVERLQHNAVVREY